MMATIANQETTRAKFAGWVRAFKTPSHKLAKCQEYYSEGSAEFVKQRNWEKFCHGRRNSGNFRRNGGIPHPCWGRIFSTMIHWMLSFYKFYGICEILHLLPRKKEVVTSWYFQWAALILRITGAQNLVKNHRYGEFQVKIARNGRFLTPFLMNPKFHIF